MPEAYMSPHRSHPRLFLALAALALASLTAASASAAGPKVALLHTSSAQATDLQAKLNATGAFTQIDTININTVTPTLTQLQAYDAVAIWSYNTVASPITMGDRLASYLDSGKGVVVFTYATYETGDVYGLGGRYVNSYSLMTPQSYLT